METEGSARPTRERKGTQFFQVAEKKEPEKLQIKEVRSEARADRRVVGDEAKRRGLSEGVVATKGRGLGVHGIPIP